MFLSICIPTYNRCKFLKKNLDLLAQQIRECDALNDVEINVSDNGSPDDTDFVVKDFISNNKDIKVGYNRFEQNLGPDKNYISAMYMAHGEYSILLGDDDFLKEKGLKTIFTILQSHQEVDMFLSNRTEVDENGKILKEKKFLRSDVNSMLFDFSEESHAGYYFALCDEVGGCFTFISSLIYKTGILKEIGPYNGSLDGTYYSFWFYLWGKLVRGGKLYYYNNSYILNTQIVNDNFGHDLVRTLVEFEGFYKAYEILFKNKTYARDFLQVPKRTLSLRKIVQEGIMTSTLFEQRMIPVISKSFWTEWEINDIKYMCSLHFHLKCILFKILPYKMIVILRKIFL